MNISLKNRKKSLPANNPYRSKLTKLAGSVCICIAALSSATADDTEVFFGQPDSDSAAKANVLFILDTSLSMGAVDWGATSTRLQRMKDAMVTILDNVNNVNVGLMRFNSSEKGGPILFPVTPINKEVCDKDPTNCSEVSGSAAISSNDADVEENVDSTEVVTDNEILALSSPTPAVNFAGSANSALAAENTVGLRFNELNIPQGAVIKSATLQFVASEVAQGLTQFSLKGELSPDSDPLSDADADLSSRTTTEEEATWNEAATWEEDEVYSTKQINTVLQEIVNQEDWCGGNAATLMLKGLGFERNVYSHDNNDTKAPVLTYTYSTKTTPYGGGCARKTIVAGILDRTDDAYEREFDGFVNVSLGGHFVPDYFGIFDMITSLRFNELNVPRGSTILSADLIFEVSRYNAYNDSLEVRIEGENIGNSPEFDNWSRYTISGRAKTTPVIWKEVAGPARGAIVTSDDVSPIVQQIVNRGDWDSGNAMSLFLSHEAGDSTRQFHTFESKQTSSPKLRIEYQSYKTPESVNKRTAREVLKEKVSSLRTVGGTPTLSTYQEAIDYYRGEPVNHGKSRYGSRYLRVSHPYSYTGGTVGRHPNCSDENLDNALCAGEIIYNDPVYSSPITDTCQTNYIVILSDGAPTSEGRAEARARDFIGGTCTGLGQWSCADDLSKWINENDQKSDLEDDQVISTHTIGFNFSSPYLQSIATNGGGTYYQANSSAQLVDAFDEIIGDALEVDTNFVAPSATVNQFNRLTNRTDVYFSLFKPASKPMWTGNLKRYQVGTDNDDKVVIKDILGATAIDPATGFFNKYSKSWWSDNVDGNMVEAGGAAAELEFNGANTRKVYTYTGDNNGIPLSGVDLTASAQALVEGNAAITTGLLGLEDSGMSAYDQMMHRTELLQWARGLDRQDIDGDDDKEDWRKHMGDAMHSRPALLTYANGANPYTTIFVGTNEGYLHAIEHINGTELFSFVPKELLPNLNIFWENKVRMQHPYGIDGAISTWHQDKNNDAFIDADEKVLLFTGLRRGGNTYYAFDVSKREEPRLAWVIDPSTPGFEDLGQTWSKMTPTTIFYEGEKTDVLIFGGGYDTNQDKPEGLSSNRLPRSPDTVGRGIYIVKTETGELLFSALGTSGGSVPPYNEMEYAFAGDMTLLDTDADGMTDQIYAADLGGQVWRFDFEKFHLAGSSAPLIKGGVLAKIGGDAIADERRFYYAPDVAMVTDAGRRFLSISIGSGWRAHPLDKIGNDRFYMIKSSSVFKAPKGYGKSLDGGSTYTPILEDDLVNITNNYDATINQYGWFLDLQGQGEKVLGTSLTADHKVFFTSYVPGREQLDSCSPTVGGGSFYALNVLNGGPAMDLNGDGKITADDISSELTTSGIPPSPTSIIHDGKIAITTGLTTVDPEIESLSTRTFWVDESDVND